MPGVSQMDSPLANATFGRIEIPESFDLNKFGLIQQELSDLQDKYGAKF